ncbi:hypothetical protein [Pseudidiomarina salilacus]|uniref:hypothetical protein n=1 Tax=Pseudidiomarina salilacus TaxID=3384452 RepID=UPI00398464FD
MMNQQQRQSGVSLISLLIGLLIASIVVVAMMTVYQTSVRTMMKSAESARLQSESLSTLLTSHLSLQGAGYGMPVDDLLDNPDMAIDFSAAQFNGSGRLVTGGAGIALVWRYGVDTNNDFEVDNFRCEGLYVSADVGVVQLVSNSSCSTARRVSWPSIPWLQVPLASPSQLTNLDGEDAEINNFFVNLEDRDPPCSPFGMSDNASVQGVLGRRAVEVGYQRLVDGTPQTVSTTTCLVNLVPEGVL